MTGVGGPDTMGGAASGEVVLRGLTKQAGEALGERTSKQCPPEPEASVSVPASSFLP